LNFVEGQGGVCVVVGWMNGGWEGEATKDEEKRHEMIWTEIN
jgi:hypothetical protein